MADTTLSGKVAIVTGAASPIGMGRAMALALVGAGARVGLADLDARGLAGAVAAASEIGGDSCALALEADISDSAQAEAIVQQAIAEFGGLHILVNNAGIQLRRPSRPGAPGSASAPTSGRRTCISGIVSSPST